STKPTPSTTSSQDSTSDEVSESPDATTTASAPSTTESTTSSQDSTSDEISETPEATTTVSAPSTTESTTSSQGTTDGTTKSETVERTGSCRYKSPHFWHRHFNEKLPTFHLKRIINFSETPFPTSFGLPTSFGTLTPPITTSISPSSETSIITKPSNQTPAPTLLPILTAGTGTTKRSRYEFDGTSEKPNFRTIFREYSLTFPTCSNKFSIAKGDNYINKFFSKPKWIRCSVPGMKPNIQAVPFNLIEAQNVFNMRHVLTTDISEWETVMLRRIMKEFPKFDVFVVIFDEEKKLALMNPEEEVNSEAPFKRHEIDWIVFYGCTPRPNREIIEEFIEKMREKLGRLNDCPTSYVER
ncbi:hypothetical protein CRE_16297, partial [Caenorhabditis remanei]